MAQVSRVDDQLGTSVGSCQAIEKTPSWSAAHQFYPVVLRRSCLSCAPRKRERVAVMVSNAFDLAKALVSDVKRGETLISALQCAAAMTQRKNSSLHFELQKMPSAKRARLACALSTGLLQSGLLQERDMITFSSEARAYLSSPRFIADTSALHPL